MKQNETKKLSLPALTQFLVLMVKWEYHFSQYDEKPFYSMVIRLLRTLLSSARLGLEPLLLSSM
jgi:hypothetical protein